MINLLAEELLINDPDASLWDFLRVWYEYLHGSFPVSETDEEVTKIVYLHLSGFSPRLITKALDINQGNVVAYLKSMGFKPWTSIYKDTPMLRIYKDLVGSGDENLICEMYGISKHVARKIGEEFETAKRVLNYAN